MSHNSKVRVIFYSSLKGVERSTYLELLNVKNKDAVHDILGYPENSVARLINTDFATIDTEITIAQANEHLRKNHKDSEAANVIYVVDHDGRLIDDIPVRRFVLNDPNKTIEEIRPKYAWITSHTCRRSFCTNEFLAGTPVDLIMKISGHKSLRDFYRYIRISQEEAGQKIGARHNFEVIDAQFKIFGLCPNCREQQKPLSSTGRTASDGRGKPSNRTKT